MKKFLSFITAAALLTAGLPVNAIAEGEKVTYAPVLISEANFPDPAFRQYLLDKIDTDDSGYVDGEEGVDLVIRLNTVSDELTSLKGIELLEGVTVLDADNCRNLTEVDISHNPEIFSLGLRGTGITEIDLSNNLLISSLTLEDTDITEIDLSKHSCMKYLYLGQTAITSLDISSSYDIEVLFLDRTKITELDVSHCGKLQRLYLYRSRVANIQLPDNSVINWLDVERTAIKSLDLSKLPQLETLYARKTTIDKLDFSCTPKLTSLYIGDSVIGEFDLSPLTGLANLDLSGGVVDKVDLSHHPKLVNIVAENINDEELDLNCCPLLSRAHIGGDNLKKVNMEKCTAIDDFSFIGNAVTDIDLTNMPELEQLILESDSLTSIDLSKNPKLKELTLECINIRNIDLSGNPDITMLKVWDSGLIYLNLDNQTVLKGNLMGNTGFDNRSNKLVDCEFYGNSINLAYYADEGFDPSRITFTENVTVDGSVLTVTNAAEDMRYGYYTGNDNVSDYFLHIDPGVVNLMAENITLSEREFDYTGKAIEPEITMTFGGVKYRDFTVEYRDNVNAGIATAVITGNSSEDADIKFRGTVEMSYMINKLIPEYTVPTGLKAVVGTSLSDIELPDGFSWNEPGTMFLSEGTMTCTATYTPEDAVNYETISDIEIEVEVTENKGDVNLDGKVNITDAQLTLTYYASKSAGVEYSFHDDPLKNSEAMLAADVDGDGKITLSDARYILTYYAQKSAGMNPKWENIL